jgi:5'-3' exonuclease
LVLLALLVGSDYTPGILGVGPVTALEILAAFPTGSRDDNILRGLQRFQDWWNGGMTKDSGKTSLKNKLKDVQIVEGMCTYSVNWVISAGHLFTCSKSVTVGSIFCFNVTYLLIITIPLWMNNHKSKNPDFLILSQYSATASFLNFLFPAFDFE